VIATKSVGPKSQVQQVVCEIAWKPHNKRENRVLLDITATKSKSPISPRLHFFATRSLFSTNEEKNLDYFYKGFEKHCFSINNYFSSSLSKSRWKCTRGSEITNGNNNLRFERLLPKRRNFISSFRNIVVTSHSLKTVTPKKEFVWRAQFTQLLVAPLVFLDSLLNPIRLTFHAFKSGVVNLLQSLERETTPKIIRGKKNTVDHRGGVELLTINIDFWK